MNRIRITGPEESAYRLGEPMHVFDGTRLLATLEPVSVSQAGASVHLENFHATEWMENSAFNVGKLIFLEVCEFLASHFAQIQQISFAFIRPVELLGEGVQQAASRVETALRMGATNVQVLPGRDATHGNFVVTGTWNYSDSNVASLRSLLEEERAIYAAWVSRALRANGTGWLGGLRALLGFGRRDPR
jgi:hypothetical protein